MDDGPGRQGIGTQHTNDILTEFPLKNGCGPLLADELGAGNTVDILQLLIVPEGIRIVQQGIEEHVDPVLALEAAGSPVEITEQYVGASEKHDRQGDGKHRSQRREPGSPKGA